MIEASPAASPSKIRVLIVDDSVAFRSQIKSVLSQEKHIEIVGTVQNGRLALKKLETHAVDLMILDMEMPEMNGLETLEALNNTTFTTKVIVFSAQTNNDISKALEALKLGAVDIVRKPDGSANSLIEALEGIKDELLPKIIQFLPQKPQEQSKKILTHERTPKPFVRHLSLTSLAPGIAVIASSTGGPQALEQVLSDLPKLRIPLLIVQHMPPVFTQILAKRLKDKFSVPIREAKHGETLAPGQAYLAPGDYHMSLQKESERTIICLNQNAKRNSVRPAADFLFESAARIYGKFCFGMVLTGMGEDGKEGAVAIKEAGGAIMIQNEDSSTVWGMPGAVHALAAFDFIGDLQACNAALKTILK